MLETKYIIKSGNSFLLNAESGQMVCNNRDPVSAALIAKRYSSLEEANNDMVILENRGLFVEIIELQIGKKDNKELE